MQQTTPGRIITHHVAMMIADQMRLPTLSTGMEKRLAACLPVTVLIVVLLFAFFLVPVASGTSSVNVPLDHWAYGALDKLDGFGLIHSDLPGTRPYTRMEIGRLVKEALVERANSGKSFPPLLDYFFQKFQEEFKEEIDAWDPGRSQPARSYLKPVEEARMRYVFSDGDPRTFTKFPDTKYTMNATEGTPLVYNNDGIIYGQGSNMSLQMSSSMRLFDVVSGYIEPVFIVRQNGGTDANLDQVEAEVLRGYGKLTVWNLELEAGKDSMWWGQGRHGELLMTNNAEPLNMIKLSNPTPAILPWYFSYLGPSKFTIFAGQLDDFYVNLAPPKSSVQELELTHVGLSGLRFDIKPHPLFEMAFSTAFLFGGNGRPNFSFGDYVSTLFGFFGRSASEAAKTDQLASLDFRIQLPWLKNAVLYGEYAGEDSGGLEYPEEFLFGDVGWLVGLYFPAITDDGRTDLRIEYANDAHRKDSTPGVWYGHWAYASGYTNQMMFIGHHMGGDAQDAFVRVSHYLRDDLVFGIDYDFMERGLTLSPIRETIHQVGFDCTYDIKRNVSLTARYGFGAVSDFDMQEGGDRQDQLLMLEIKCNF